ncbi:hypothetical protein AB0C07_11795 [Actinoplanes missouriensis]|uniref:hypothetical protein n=1 Tax=Actinoplanes missouriensis TaxID=1866 RepID=UPI0033F0DB98
MPLATQSLMFIPDYRFFSVRDYSAVDQPGASEALSAAHRDIIAASDYEIFVVCAQDQLKIDVSVTVDDDLTSLDRHGDGTVRFTIPFPTAQLHAGDAFGNAITMDLPRAGAYSVTIEHTGRERAREILSELLPHTADLHGDELRDVLNQWAGTERYQVTLFSLE